MKILVILSRFPYPLEKGDKLRAYQHLKILSTIHEVHLIALSDKKVAGEHYEKIAAFCATVHVISMNPAQIMMNLSGSVFRRLPLQVGYFYSAGIERQIQRICHDIKPDLLYCQLIRTAIYAKDLKVAVKAIDYQDAFSAGTAQRKEKAPSLLMPLYNRELSLVKKFEQQSFNWFQKHLVISRSDRDQLAIIEKSKIHIQPNGVDTGFFSPENSTPTSDIVFVGNMQYPPNVDAAQFLVNEIMPVVWNKIPDAKLILCGAEPSKSVRALASQNVKVTGWVDDVRDYYRGSRIFVAPMRIGIGLQNKLLEAMSIGLPCVTTSLSATPLHGEHGREYLIADSSEDFGNAIIRLLNDQELRLQIGSNGQSWVKETFSIQSASESLLSYLEKK